MATGASNVETLNMATTQSPVTPVVQKAPMKSSPHSEQSTRQQSTTESKIKISTGMDKIKYSLLNNWVESGFIENMRGQIRCQLIGELKHPFKHQKQGTFPNSSRNNHLSLDRRILNSIIIDYLSKYGYNYSLSVFKSEIGGELIGSISPEDTQSQLRLNEEQHRTRCFMEQLVDAHKINADISRQNDLNTFHQKNLEWEQSAVKNDAQKQTESLLEKERMAVQALQQQLEQQMKLLKMDESSKFNTLHSDLESANKTILSLKEQVRNMRDQQENENTVRSMDNQWKTKYSELYQELMETINRENELQNLLDEESIKLKSAKREVTYLEKLVSEQGDSNNIAPNTITKKTDSDEEKQSVKSLESPQRKRKIRWSSPIRPIALKQIKVDADSSPDPIVDAPNKCGLTPITMTPLTPGTAVSVFSPPEAAPSPPTPSIRQPLDSNNVSNQYSRKCAELELDLKKRLRVQAMLETESRKVNNHTKNFFNQLNQQKSQTSEIIQKLQNTVPLGINQYGQSGADSVIPHIVEDNQLESNTNNLPSECIVRPPSKLELQKKRNRENMVQYAWNRMRNERNELQQQIRMDLRPKALVIDTADINTGASANTVNYVSNSVQPMYSGSNMAAHYRLNVRSEDTENTDDIATTGTVIDLSESVCEEQDQSMTECFEDVVKIDIDSPFNVLSNLTDRSLPYNLETPSLARKSETTSPVDAFKTGDGQRADSPIPDVEATAEEVASEMEADDIESTVFAESSDVSDSMDSATAGSVSPVGDREDAVADIGDIDNILMSKDSTVESGSEIEDKEDDREKMEFDGERSDIQEAQAMDDEAERERLEREQLEQDLLEDYTQSESFSGVGFLQNDFLEQYQKHIESISEQ